MATERTVNANIEGEEGEEGEEEEEMGDTEEGKIRTIVPKPFL